MKDEQFYRVGGIGYRRQVKMLVRAYSYYGVS